MSNINRIILHCAATPNGRPIGNAKETASQVIDRWHKERGFARQQANLGLFNPELRHIGYQYVIDIDGTCTTGRREGEVGAHTLGYNTGTIGICMAGTDKFTVKQWTRLKALVTELVHKYPKASLHGHREFANKICPGFDVADWSAVGLEPLPGHILD